MRNRRWIPPGGDGLTACDGFYIDSSAIYGANSFDSAVTDTCWQNFLTNCFQQMQQRERSFEIRCAWNQGRFVIMSNRLAEIAAEDLETYVAVFCIVPESCPCPGPAKRAHQRYMQLLLAALTTLYPGHVKYKHDRKVG